MISTGRDYPEIRFFQVGELILSDPDSDTMCMSLIFLHFFFWAIATSLRHQGCHVSVCGRDLAFTSEDEAEGWKVGATWSREITLFQWLLKSFSKPDLWGWAFHPLFLSPLNLALLWLVRSYIMYIYIFINFNFLQRLFDAKQCKKPGFRCRFSWGILVSLSLAKSTGAFDEFPRGWWQRVRRSCRRCAKAWGQKKDTHISVE